MHQFFLGYSIIEISGTAAEIALNRLVREKIAFWNVSRIDSMTILISVFSKQKDRTMDLIASSMCDARITEEFGFRKRFASLKHRILFILLIASALFSALILPKFVFFYEVIGNDTVPSEEILQELYAHGIGFGTYGPDIHPAWVKNHMIRIIPKLQWLTIVQNGCRATVIVRERPDIPETENRRGFSNVIASQNGMITKMSVFAGQPLVKIGDIVEKGQLLVSGVVDLERVYVLENANAEIFARSWREIWTCIPEKYAKKSYYTSTQLEISVQIKQKRIKLFGNSRISHASCDKMIKRWEVSLPGGLSLPLSLEVSKVHFYDREEQIMQSDEAELLLSSHSEAFVRNRMKAGELLNTAFYTENKNGLLICHAVMECHEMIAERVTGKIVIEE